MSCSPPNGENTGGPDVEQPSKVDGVEGRNDGPQDTTVVLLGAGRPARGVAPSALAQAGSRGRVLDWLRAAMRPIGASQTVFVGGYRVEEVITSFPDLSFCLNRRLQIDGPLGSLMSAPIEGGTTIFVGCTDVVYGSEIVESLKGRDEDAVFVVDCAWRDRYSGRPLVDLRRAEKWISAAIAS
jgi:hypothetical protein